MGVHQCRACRKALPVLRRSNRRYCSDLCRVRAYLIREGGGTKERREHRALRQQVAEIAGVTAAAVTFAVVARSLVMERRQRESLETDSRDLDETLTQKNKELEVAQQQISQLRDELTKVRDELTKEREAAKVQAGELKDAQKEIRKLGATIDTLRTWVRAVDEETPGAAPRKHLPPSTDDSQRVRERERRLRKLGSQQSVLDTKKAELDASAHREALLTTQVVQLKGALERSKKQEAESKATIESLEKKIAKQVKGAPKARRPSMNDSKTKAALADGAEALATEAAKRLGRKAKPEPKELPENKSKRQSKELPDTRRKPSSPAKPRLSGRTKP